MNSRPSSFCLLPSAFCLALAVLSTAPAAGHGLNVFASAEGDIIAGHVYYPGGGRVRGVAVSVTGPDGRKLAETNADENGEFSFRAQYRCDHLLTVDPGDGHRAEWTVEAGELSVDLPSFPGASPAAHSHPAPSEDAPTPAEGDPLAQIVEREIAKHVAPLRKQIEQCRVELQEHQAKVRMRDIVGGVGWLVGLAGIAFYFLGARRKSGG
jgi:nickel transport protein